MNEKFCFVLTRFFLLHRFKHCYELTGVVVHTGGLFYGHFLTYRRGAGRYYSRYETLQYSCRFV